MVARSGNSNTDDKQSFVNDVDGNVARNVTGTVNTLTGFEIPAHDTINVTYPTSTTEVYTYVASAVTVATITVTYATSSKNNITSVVKS